MIVAATGIVMTLSFGHGRDRLEDFFMDRPYTAPDEELDEYMDDILRIQLDLLRELLQESPGTADCSGDVIQQFPRRRLRLLFKLQEIYCFLLIRTQKLTSWDVWPTVAGLIIALNARNDDNAVTDLDPELKSLEDVCDGKPQLESWKRFEQLLYDYADEQPNTHEQTMARVMRDYPDFKLANIGLEFSGLVANFVQQCDDIELLDGAPIPIRTTDAAAIFFLLLALENGIKMRDKAEANWKSISAHISTDEMRSLCQDAWRCLREFVGLEVTYIEMPASAVERIGD